MGGCITDYAVVARAFERKSGKPIGKARMEMVSTSNAYFKDCKTIQDVHKEYERFWNDSTAEEVVFVQAISPSKAATVQATPTPAKAPEKPAKQLNHDYVIIVAEVVRGKSKGPKGFKRYKPFKYDDYENRHPIVYAQYYPDAIKDAIISETKNIRSEMYNMSDYSSGYIKSYSLVLHDVTDDKVIPVGVDELGDTGYLYDGTKSSNKILKDWKILPKNNPVKYYPGQAFTTNKNGEITGTVNPSGEIKLIGNRKIPKGERRACPSCKNVVLEHVKSNPPALSCPSCGKAFIENPAFCPICKGMLTMGKCKKCDAEGFASVRDERQKEAARARKKPRQKTRAEYHCPYCSDDDLLSFSGDTKLWNMGDAEDEQWKMAHGEGYPSQDELIAQGYEYFCNLCGENFKKKEVLMKMVPVSNPPVHFSTWEFQKPHWKSSVISGRDDLCHTKTLKLFKDVIKKAGLDIKNDYLYSKHYVKDGLKGVEIGINTKKVPKESKKFFKKVEKEMSKILEFEPDAHKFRANPQEESNGNE